MKNIENNYIKNTVKLVKLIIHINVNQTIIHTNVGQQHDI